MSTINSENTAGHAPASHTPGPWHVSYAGRTQVFDQHNNEVAFVATYGAGFGPQGWPFPWHHAEANARLIAAAPELLEALKTFVDAYMSVNYRAAVERAFSEAVAAIAKATEKE